MKNITKPTKPKLTEPKRDVLKEIDEILMKLYGETLSQRISRQIEEILKMIKDKKLFTCLVNYCKV